MNSRPHSGGGVTLRQREPRPPAEYLAGRGYDVVVIGGGINGAAIARAAAAAGLAVLLLEKHDFGWGTTWRSTKLIHGGLRYLEHAEFGLVFESLRDQARLLRLYPDMVRPLSLMLPVFRGDSHRPSTIGLGLTLYDLLSRSRHLPGHWQYSPAAALLLEPRLRAEGLRAAFTYADCQAAYPERLCMQTILEAQDHGAAVLNHAEVVALLTGSDGAVRGVSVHDAASKASFDVQCRVVVNAAGPWVDAVLGRVKDPPGRQIGGTRGTHLVADLGPGAPLHALYAEARSDHRPFFVVPWRDRHLVGTTDSRFDGDVDSVNATEAEVDYLIYETNALLPGAGLTRHTVDYAYAGVRPLPASQEVRAGAITRRHIVRDHAADGHPGLLSIVGGKLSTYLNLASQTLARIRPHLAGEMSRPQRGAGPIPRAAHECGRRAGLTEVLRRLGPSLLDHLRSLYGPRLDGLLEIVSLQPELLRRLCPHGPEIEAQVVLAVRDESALTLSDTLLRRTGSGWNPCLALDCMHRVAELMAGELGWSLDYAMSEIAAYRAEIQRTFLLPGRVQGSASPPAR